MSRETRTTWLAALGQAEPPVGSRGFTAPFDVFLALENDGVDKFKKSWQELLEATQDQLDVAT